MNVLFSLYVLVLFFVLTPGILVTLPKNGSKMMVTAVHGVIFAVVLFLTGRAVWMMTAEAMEGFQEGMKKRCPKGQIRKTTTTCVPKSPGGSRTGKSRRRTRGVPA
jgi:hypothetical protein